MRDYIEALIAELVSHWILYWTSVAISDWNVVI